ncbi:hypothetical protein NYE37_13725 [Thermoactinomyces sp. FSL K6-2592]|jgi:hypothetical protein|uniref:hypothetical protein n=1 Tax=Thermoactinomyces sp. FSL K6-2592 TaxID=2975347 RepID=UPI0030F63F1A
MLIFDEQKLIQTLQKEGWANHEIRAVIGHLGKVSSQLQKTFDEWLNHQIISDEPLVEGLSIRTMMDLYGCNFLDGLFHMNVCLDSPDLIKKYKDFLFTKEEY